MADEINKKITIDVEVTADGQQQIAQYKAALDSLRGSIGALSNPFSNLSNNIVTLDKNITTANSSLDKFNKQNKETESSTNKVKESVKGLAETYKAFDDVIKLVKAGAASLEGVLTAGISVIVTYLPEITEWITALVKGKDAVDETKLRVNAMNEALESSDYSNAIKQLNELKINVGLARQGYLDKKKVLNEYNNSLGQTMGKTQDLDIAESNMVSKGDAYIKMTLLKASAQMALQDAAKKAYEAEQDKIKSDDDALTFWDKAKGYLKIAASGIGNIGVGAASEYGNVQAENTQTAIQRRKESSDDATKQKDALLAIAKKFQQQAADIAKKAGFDIFSGQYASTDNTGQSKALRENAFNETEKLYNDSLTRKLRTTYEAYGNEVLAENTHYQDELTRLDVLLKKKLIKQDEYNKVTQQLQTEHHDSLASIINKYNEQDEEKTEQATNELEALKIKAMKEGTEKQKAELNLQLTESGEQLDKIEVQLTERITKLGNQINDAKTADPNADVSQLQHLLDAQWKLIELNSQKRTLLEKQTQDAIAKIDNDAAQKKQIDKDEEKISPDEDAVKKAKGSKAKFNAEKQLIMDRYQFEIDKAKGNDKEIKKLEKARDAEISALKKKSQTEFKDFALKETQDISNAAFSIVTNSIKQQSDAKIAGLEKDKAGELSNSSLTSAQKLAIENKYKKQEAAVKVKAFKDEQKASIAQALINGALAITKAEAQTGVLGTFVIPGIIAETAIQVAKIASQKPPVYAQGGYFKSDGKGAVLPGYSRTDNTNAYLRSGEAVVVSEAMQVPWARNLVSAINVGFGGRDFSVSNPGKGYAIGGIFTDGGNANRYYNQPVTDQKNLANTIAYQMINNFPPVYVDVKDINNQQNILAQTINRVNL